MALRPSAIAKATLPEPAPPPAGRSACANPGLPEKARPAAWKQSPDPSRPGRHVSGRRHYVEARMAGLEEMTGTLWTSGRTATKCPPPPHQQKRRQEGGTWLRSCSEEWFGT